MQIARKPRDFITTYQFHVVCVVSVVVRRVRCVLHLGVRSLYFFAFSNEPVSEASPPTNPPTKVVINIAFTGKS